MEKTIVLPYYIDNKNETQFNNVYFYFEPLNSLEIYKKYKN